MSLRKCKQVIGIGCQTFFVDQYHFRKYPFDQSETISKLLSTDWSIKHILKWYWMTKKVCKPIPFQNLFIWQMRRRQVEMCEDYLCFPNQKIQIDQSANNHLVTSNKNRHGVNVLNHFRLIASCDSLSCPLTSLKKPIILQYN